MRVLEGILLKIVAIKILIEKETFKYRCERGAMQISEGRTF